MSVPTRKPWMFSLLATIFGAAFAFALLTLLHHWLGGPAGERFDLAVQLYVHGWTNPGSPEACWR